MRHRIGMAGSTGLGGGDPAELQNNWPTNKRTNSIVRRCLRDAVNKYFTKDFGVFGTSAWCDFGYSARELYIGQEPAYFGDNYKVICIAKNKKYSFIATGHAFGMYGSGIKKTTKYYKDYKYNCKFVQFVDRWHKVLYT